MCTCARHVWSLREIATAITGRSGLSRQALTALAAAVITWSMWYCKYQTGKWHWLMAISDIGAKPQISRCLVNKPLTHYTYRLPQTFRSLDTRATWRRLTTSSMRSSPTTIAYHSAAAGMSMECKWRRIVRLPLPQLNWLHQHSTQNLQMNTVRHLLAAS